MNNIFAHIKKTMEKENCLKNLITMLHYNKHEFESYYDYLNCCKIVIELYNKLIYDVDSYKEWSSRLDVENCNNIPSSIKEKILLEQLKLREMLFERHIMSCV